MRYAPLGAPLMAQSPSHKTASVAHRPGLFLLTPQTQDQMGGSPWCSSPGIEITGAIHRLQLPASQKHHAWTQTAAISDPMPDLRWVHRIKHPGCFRVRNGTSAGSEIPSCVESEVGIRSYADFIVRKSRRGQLYRPRRKGRRSLLFGLRLVIVRNVRRNDRSVRPDHQQSEPTHGLCPHPPARALPRAAPLTISCFLPCDAYHDNSDSCTIIKEELWYPLSLKYALTSALNLGLCAKVFLGICCRFWSSIKGVQFGIGDRREAFCSLFRPTGRPAIPSGHGIV